MPPLTALRAFEATARLGGFTKAAAELAMTQAAVSYQVKQLESRLGVTLFKRSGRNVQLTPVGEQLSAAASEAFGLLRMACANAAELQNTRLRITALPTIASNWLVPRLGDFQAKFPDYAVQLDSSVDAIDLRMSQFDVAIRTGDGDWPGCEAVRLLPNTYTVVCAPDLIATGQVRQPDDLLHIPLFGRKAWWTDWLEAAGLTSSERAGCNPTDLGTQQSEVTAALMQGGAAIITPAFFMQDLESGRIEAPFPIIQSSENSYWLAFRKGASSLPNIRDFASWIVNQSRREPHWPGDRNPSPGIAKSRT